MSSEPPGPLAWVDGELVVNATVPIDDASFLNGHGVFEAVEISNGQPFALSAHLDRLERSASAVALDAPDRTLVQHAIDAVFNAMRDTLPDVYARSVARITLTGGSPGGRQRLVVSWRSWPDRSNPAAIMVSPWRRNEHSPLAGVKSTSYQENVVVLAEAVAQGCDEAILLNSRSDLCEGTGSNVFVVIGGELVTPPRSSGLLAGVTRDLLLDAGIGAERLILASELGGITEAFLTSTTRHVQPIARWDGRPLLVDGPHTTDASSAWNRIRYG